MIGPATTLTPRLLAFLAILSALGGREAHGQEEPRKPADPTAGVYRSDQLGIEYELVPHRGHFAAKIVRVATANAPVLAVQVNNAPYQLEVGDLIVALDDQVIDSSRDVNNHVDLTTVDVVDVRTGQPLRGTMRLPPAAGTAPMPTPTPGPAPTAESRKVRVLLVIDTASKLAGLDQDRANIASMFDEFRDQGRAEVTVLQGADATADRVVAFFRAQPDASADTLLFYYSGHGATDPRLGHYMALTQGPRLVRSALRAEMARLRPRLAVVLTDCCSNVAAIPVAPGAPQPGVETVRDLFFRASGVTDLTAATYDPRTGVGDSAWCGDSGGFFTTSFTELVLHAHRGGLDRDRDGRVSWGEIVPHVVANTNRRYQEYRNGVLRDGRNPVTGRPYPQGLIDALRKQAEQKPQAFQIASP